MCRAYAAKVLVARLLLRWIIHPGVFRSPCERMNFMHVSYQSESLLVKLPAQKLFLKGDAVAALRQTTGKNAQRKRQNGYVETSSATPTDLFRSDHTLSPGRP